MPGELDVRQKLLISVKDRFDPYTRRELVMKTNTYTLIQDLVSRTKELQFTHEQSEKWIRGRVATISGLLSGEFNKLWFKYFKHTKVNILCGLEGGSLTTAWDPAVGIYRAKELKVDKVKLRKFCKEFEELTGIRVVILK